MYKCLATLLCHKMVRPCLLKRASMKALHCTTLIWFNFVQLNTTGTPTPHLNVLRSAFFSTASILKNKTDLMVFFTRCSVKKCQCFKCFEAVAVVTDRQRENRRSNVGDPNFPVYPIFKFNFIKRHTLDFITE